MNEEWEARRWADTIIAQLTQANAALGAKVPELEAPRTEEPPVDSVSAAGEAEMAEPRSDTGGPQETRERSFAEELERRSWWKRVFGG